MLTVSPLGPSAPVSPGGPSGPLNDVISNYCDFVAHLQ